MKIRSTRRKVATTFAAGFMALALLTGCSNSSDDGSEPEALDIGMMIPSAAPFFTVLGLETEKEAKAQGLEFTLTNAQGDLEQENAQIQQFIAQGKDAIIVVAGDSKGTSASVRQANAAGIPVIALSTAIEDAETVTYVGADNVKFGQLLADATVEALDSDSGKIGMIMGILGSSASIDRLAGFKQQMQEKYPGIEIIEKQTANWDNNQALQVTQDFLSKYGPGEIDAIVGQGPETLSGATFAKKSGRDEVQFIVGDVPKAVAAGIKDGTLAAAVYQDPVEQAKAAIHDAVLAATGKADEVKVPHMTSVQAITQENLDVVNPYTY